MEKNNFEINIPKSYNEQNRAHPSSSPKIDNVPRATNKVRKIVIRGILKNDISSD